MPKVGTKTFPYTPQGMKAARKYARQKNQSREANGLPRISIEAPVTKSGLKRIAKEQKYGGK